MAPVVEGSQCLDTTGNHRSTISGDSLNNPTCEGLSGPSKLPGQLAAPPASPPPATGRPTREKNGCVYI